MAREATARKTAADVSPEKKVNSLIRAVGKPAKDAQDKAREKALSSLGEAKELIQEACISVFLHALAYGDYTGAQRLVDALSKDRAAKAASVVKWFETTMGLSRMDETKGRNTNKFTGWKGKNFLTRKQFDLAKSYKWWTVQTVEESEREAWGGYGPEDISADILGLVKKLARQQEKATKEAEKRKVSVESLYNPKPSQDALKSLLAMLNVERGMEFDANGQHVTIAPVKSGAKANVH